MFSPSLAVAAVAGMMATGSLAQQPAWQSDYALALKSAAVQQKPLVVFIGQGANGYTQVLTEGTFGTDAATLLNSKFVCLYVDTATDAGRTLAGSFEMTKGVVVSDRSGAVQAYRHAGALTSAELATELTRLSSPVVVSVTRQPTVTSSSYYSPQPTFSGSSIGGTSYFRSGGG